MRLLLSVTLLLLTVAGCGVHRSAAPAPDTTTTTQTTTTTSTTTTTTTATTTTTVPPTAAADGTNLRACQDLTCEVSIKAKDMVVLNGLGTLIVLSVDATSVTLLMPDGSIMTFGGQLTINDAVVIETLRTGATGAIVRMSPA